MTLVHSRYHYASCVLQFITENGVLGASLRFPPRTKGIPTLRQAAHGSTSANLTAELGCEQGLRIRRSNKYRPPLTNCWCCFSLRVTKPRSFPVELIDLFFRNHQFPYFAFLVVCFHERGSKENFRCRFR